MLSRRSLFASLLALPPGQFPGRVRRAGACLADRMAYRLVCVVCVLDRIRGRLMGYDQQGYS